MSVVILSGNGETVRFDGSADAQGLILRSLDGWLDSPGAKVDLTERGNGDGAHDVLASQVRDSARTIEVGYRLLAPDPHGRDWLLAEQSIIRRLLHGTVMVRVLDATADAYATGYVDSVDIAETMQNVNHQTVTGQIIVVCPRPEILSTQTQSGQLMPLRPGEGRGGLTYNQSMLRTWWEGEPNNSVSVLNPDTLAGDSGVRYPLTYRKRSHPRAENQMTFTNRGSSPAYPLLRVHGPMPDGVDLVDSAGQWLRCRQPVAGEPLVLDCRARTATVGGLDVSRMLTSRGFPVVPPGGSVTVTLRTAGDGWVDAEMHDTWM